MKTNDLTYWFLNSITVTKRGRICVKQVAQSTRSADFTQGIKRLESTPSAGWAVFNGNQLMAYRLPKSRFFNNLAELLARYDAQLARNGMQSE